jgi:hypothetical protein
VIERLQRATAVGRTACALVLAMAATFGLDVLLFRTHLYPSVIEPDSAAGQFELTLMREQRAQRENSGNMIVTLGDSRMSYLPRLSNELTPETGYVLRNAGIPGSDVRTWYYMMRELDPTRRRYRALAIGVNDYDDEDTSDQPDDDLRSLHLCAVRLRLSDALDFAWSFHSAEQRWVAFRGTLFKGVTLQQDIRAFLSNPRKRIEYVRLCHREFPSWTYNYVESDRSMVGLTIDWQTLTAVFPPGADDNQWETVTRFLLRRPAPQTGRLAALRRGWFGRIIDRYRGTGTRIVFVRLPRGPIPRPDWLARKTGSSIRELAARPDVMLGEEHAYESLERPEFFKDGMHMNREGVKRFSAMLARDMARLLGPAR